MIPKLSGDGGKIGILEEVDAEVKQLRVKNDMLKLKTHQAKKTKGLIKKEALFYKGIFVSYVWD